MLLRTKHLVIGKIVKQCQFPHAGFAQVFEKVVGGRACSPSHQLWMLPDSMCLLNREQLELWQKTWRIKVQKRVNRTVF